MVAEKRINLDNLISRYIHRPVLSNKGGVELPPLYARMGTEMESSLDQIGTKDPSWVRAVEIRYNSPTNVKRLFIGDRKVYIQYFKPQFNVSSKASGQGQSCWTRVTIDENDIIGDLVNKSLGYNDLVHQADANGEKRPDKIILTKTGLGALSNHWVMSNIEEVYITPEILMSEDIVLNIADATSIWKLLRENPAGKVANNNPVPLKIFEYANGANVNSIRNRFPRLRRVVIASNLDAIMEKSGAMGINDNMPTSLEEAGQSWLNYITKLGIANAGSFVISQVPVEAGHDPIMEFSLRPGIYKFDANILQEYTEKYKNKIQELRLVKAGLGEKAPEVKNTNKSEYEQYLDNLCESHSNAVVLSAIRLAFARVKPEDIDLIFSEMSTDGAKKYRGMLGR